jgi:Domain of unknown function (DUF397)
MEDKIDLRWRKSSFSGNGGGSCVEVGQARRDVLVRDTKDRTGPVLEITPDAWRRFAGQLKRSLAPEPAGRLLPGGRSRAWWPGRPLRGRVTHAAR